VVVLWQKAGRAEVALPALRGKDKKDGKRSGWPASDGGEPCLWPPGQP